jgi:hypothetical protein
MKGSKTRIILQGAALLLCCSPAAFAGVNVNINLGEPRPVIVAPAPPPAVYVPAPPPVYVPAPPPVEVLRVDEDINFVYPDALGFYVAVGVPYDLFFVNNNYYLYRDGRWLCASSSRGPWIERNYRELPPRLRRHRLERIRDYRSREYVIYSRDREHYRGRHFRSEKEKWREQRHDAHEARKDERRIEKVQRKDERHFEKEQRKDERRFEKEQRKDERRQEKDERRERRDER